MATKNIPLGGVSIINLNCKKKLALKSWDSDELKIELADERDLEVHQNTTAIEVRIHEDCVIHAPAQAEIKVQEVGGSASISGGFAGLELTNIGGSLVLVESNGATAHNIGGSSKLSNCRGTFKFDNIGGSLKAVGLTGTVSVMNVGGHIKVDGLAAQGHLLAGGSVKARLAESVQDLEITAGGHIKLVYPSGVGFVVHANSGANRVKLHSAEAEKSLSGGSVQTTIGTGGPTLRLRAGGAVVLMEAGQEGEDFKEEIQPEIEWVSDTEPRIREQIHQKIDRIQRRAEERAREAERRVKSAMEKIDMNMSIDIPDVVIPSISIPGFSINPKSGIVETSEPEVREKVTDDERMLVLKMLKDKQITAEEADKLLDALEGKFDKLNP